MQQLPPGFVIDVPRSGGADPIKVNQERRAERSDTRAQNSDARAANAAALSEANAAKANELANKKLAIDLAKEGLMFDPSGQLVANPAGKPKNVVNDPQRIAQITSLLDVIKRTRAQSDDFLAVGEQSKNVREWPFIGGVLGQNRADVEGLVQSVQGDLIQQQIARLSQQNGGNGVASVANSETEAARMAAAIANLSLDQSLPEFSAGLDRAEEYYKRQLQEAQAQQGQSPAGVNALRDSLGINIDPAMIGPDGVPVGYGPNDYANDTPQDIAMSGGVPMGAGGAMSDLDVRWGGGSNGEFDRAGWLEKNRGWTENDATTYIAILNANKGRKLSAEQLTSLMVSKGIPVDRKSTIDGIAADAANLGNGRGWDALYPPEQAAWDKRVEELKSQRKDDVVNPVLRGAADTGLMGQADKLFALTDTLSGGTYQDNLNERYATNAADESVNPYLRMGGQVAGGVGPTLGMAKGLSAGGARLIQGGGKFGTAAEALAGNTARSGRTANMIYGAGYGAANDSNPVRGATVGALASFGGDKLGQVVGRTVAQSGIVGKARNTLARARGRTPMRPMPKMSAPDKMMLAADPDGQALNRLSTARDLQVPMTLADVTPEFRALAGAAARRSPTARGMAEEAFTPRSRGQYERLMGAIDRDLGPTANIPQYSEDLIKQAQANSRPFYDEAFSAPGASSVDISGIAKTPMGQQGISNAYNSVRNTLGPDGQPIDATALGFDIAEGTGEATLNRVPSFETLDYFKKGLDDVIDAGFDPITKQYTADARAAIQLKQNLVGQMDSVNPAYANARQAYAGPAGEREALRLGQSSGNMTPDQMQYTIKDFSPEKRAQFALGDRSRMADNAGKVRYSGNPWEAAYGSPQAQQRLAISHPNASPRFGQQYGMERDIAVSNNAILGNSMTAERQLADQAFAGNMMSDFAFDAVTTGAPLKSGATLLGRFGKDELGRFGAKQKADALAPVLFDTDVNRALGEFLKLQNKPKVIKKAKGIFGRTAANNTGRGLGLAAPIAALSFIQE